VSKLLMRAEVVEAVAVVPVEPEIGRDPQIAVPVLREAGDAHRHERIVRPVALERRLARPRVVVEAWRW